MINNNVTIEMVSVQDNGSKMALFWPLTLRIWTL